MTQDIVGSKLPADNKYGQNGATNSSSDLPGQKTAISGFSTPCDLAAAHDDHWQKRDVGKSNVPNPHGMKDANDGGAPSGKVPAKNGYVDSPPIRKPGA